MTARLSLGFCQYGHLAGKWTINADLWDIGPEAHRVADDLHDAMIANPHATVAWTFRKVSTADACIDFALNWTYTTTYSGIPSPRERYALVVRPGMRFLLHEAPSVLRVHERDIENVANGRFQGSVTSLSVHCWPGSGILDRLDRDCRAMDRYLWLGDDLGDAKVWLHGTRVSSWRVLRAYPLNDLEPAEIAEQAAGTRYGA